VTGIYVSGYNHSRFRPTFYRDLRLWQGTINIKLPAETDDGGLIPDERIRGRDPIDANQDFLIRPCKLTGFLGYQILPINKATGKPNEYHGSKTIELSLKEKIYLQPNEELEVELQGFKD
jgi:hypothetical protein